MKRYIGRNMRTGAVYLVNANNIELANKAFQTISDGQEVADKYEVVCIDDFYNSREPQALLNPNVA